MKNIEVRALTVNDAVLLHQLMTSKKWHQLIGDRGVRTVKDAENYIREKMHPTLSVKGFVSHVIIDEESGKEVGTCSLHDRAGVEGLDIGYAILPEFENQGFATAGARKMVELAFRKYAVNRINAITTDQNLGSCRVLEKLGFVHQGYLQIAGIDHELKLYRLLRKNA